MKHLRIKAITMAMVLPLLLACQPAENSSSNSHPSFDESITYPESEDHEKREEKISKILFGFNTTYSVNLWNAPLSAMKEITEIIDQYSGLSDNYSAVSNMNNIYTINNSDKPVKIDEGLFNLLEKCLEYQDILNGYFNPLMGKLSKLWKDYLNVETGPMIPTHAMIEPLLKEAQNSKLILNKENMTAQVIGGAEIDLGAVAKGYSLKLIKEVLDKKHVKNYLINGGDSSIALGQKPDKIDFNVGLKDIKKAYFSTHDEMVSTSSMFEQGKVVNGVKYNHIINPYTGSAETNFDLVLVKGPVDPGLLDCMTTAFSCMTLEEIKPYEEVLDIDVLVYDDGEILYQSKNMEVKYH